MRANLDRLDGDQSRRGTCGDVRELRSEELARYSLEWRFAETSSVGHERSLSALLKLLRWRNEALWMQSDLVLKDLEVWGVAFLLGPSIVGLGHDGGSEGCSWYLHK